MKNGMYGETPKLKIGKFTISFMSDDPNEENVWIENTVEGEGGSFKASSLIHYMSRKSDLESILGGFFSYNL